MLASIKSILKSLELFLTLKNKQFYYDLQEKHKELEYEIIEEIEDLRQRGGSNDADRADILRERLICERSRFKHLSAFYSKTAEGEVNSD
jgi:hypothetical protein